MFTAPKKLINASRAVITGSPGGGVTLGRRVIRRLQQRRGRLFWLTTATACSLVGAVSRDSQRWNGRTGYALYRSGRVGTATNALAAAIMGDERADWRRAVEHVRTAADSHANPGWYYSLGQCLRLRGELDAAATLIHAACEREPTKPGWLYVLSQIEEQRGNLQGAQIALKRAVELGHPAAPQVVLRHASIHHHAGQWDEAASLLEDNVRRHPQHADSYKLLAAVYTSRATWGGTFSGTLADRSQGRFAFDTDREPPDFHRMARSALEHAVKLKPAQTQWMAALAGACLAEGRLTEAIEHYQTALDVAETTHHRWALRVKNKWRFELERTYHQLGQPRVEDPLFDCEIRPSAKRGSGVQSLPGLFSVRMSDMGLTVHGLLATANVDHVEIFVNGIRVRSVNVSSDSFLPQFTLLLKRKTVALLPTHGHIEIRTPDGRRLQGPAGANHVKLTVPHGNGDLLKIIKDGGQLNKKGEISPTLEETRQRQDRDLEIYAAVREFFERELGRSLFLMYGTLLGYYRDGDFIPGDDDFDAGYVSDKTDPVAAKNEAKEIIVDLIRAGFTVSFNRRGRLFRVQTSPTDVDGYHIDIHFLWFQNGNLWAHNHLCMPAEREDFLPVVDGKLRGVRVSAPQSPEVFLRGNYGPGWKVPDSGFRYYPSQVDPSVRRNLNKALLTAGEYKDLKLRVEEELGNFPGAGRLISIGSQDLYPLA